MQIFVIVLFMLVLPVLSIIQDAASGTGLVAAIGTWFVFWGVGWRLVAAGFHQITRPAFTANEIFNIKDPDASKLVLEIGFGNLALGISAITSFYFPQWVPALALAGAIFFGLAGIQHIRNQASSRAEIAAMVSDLGISAVLIFYLVWFFLL